MTQPVEFGTVLEAINECLRQQHKGALPPLWTEILEIWWQQPHLTYRTLSQELQGRGRSVGERHLRNQGADLCQALSGITETEVRKTNAVSELQRWYTGWRFQTTALWPGQAQEIAKVVGCIQQGQYRIICITGPPLIGKTEFIEAVVRQLRQQTALNSAQPPVIHRLRAQTVMTVAQLQHRLHQRRRNTHLITGAEGEDPVEAVLEALQDPQLLLILDGAEALYDPQQTAGQFKTASAAYELLLEEIVQNPTIEGCLVWVSRVLPQCLDPDRSTLFKYDLQAISFPKAALVLSSKFPYDSLKQQRLFQLCGGNLGLLLNMARHIQHSFDGNLERFIDRPLENPKTYGREWQGAIMALSPDEQVLLIWLLFCPLTYDDLLALGIPDFPRSRRVQGIQSLRLRRLVQPDSAGLYHLTPPYLRYVLADWLVRHLSQQLLQRDLSALTRCPLTRPTVAHWRQQWHRRYVLAPLGQAIREAESYWQHQHRQQLCRDLLVSVQQVPQDRQAATPTYSSGAVITLAALLEVPLSALPPLTGLTVCSADLSTANLQNAAIAACTFHQTQLPVYFTGQLVADLSADGQTLVIGDSAGRLGCWVSVRDSFELGRYHQFPAPVQLIQFKANTLLIATDQALYYWELDSDDQPKPLLALDPANPATALALSKGGWRAAVGLSNGDIIINDLLSGSNSRYQAHTTVVRGLALDDSGFTLASIGYGERVRLWDLDLENLSSAEEIPSGDRVMQSVQWQNSHLWQVATLEGTPSYRQGDQPWRDLAIPNIDSLTLSRNGQVLAGLDPQGELYCWQIPSDPLQPSAPPSQSQLPIQLPRKLAISDDGSCLLTVLTTSRSPSTVQLWDVKTGNLVWALEADSAIAPIGLQLDQVEGISSAHYQHLAEFIALPSSRLKQHGPPTPGSIQP